MISTSLLFGLAFWDYVSYPFKFESYDILTGKHSIKKCIFVNVWIISLIHSGHFLEQYVDHSESIPGKIGPILKNFVSNKIFHTLKWN